MNILKEWKELTTEYDSCSSEQEFHSFLLENKDTIIKLYELNISGLIAKNNAVITARGGKFTPATATGYGQSIDNPPRTGDMGIALQDIKGRTWTFNVPGDNWPSKAATDTLKQGNGFYKVIIKFPPDKVESYKELTNLDIEVKCNCPFFIFNGPERNALNNDYLYKGEAGQGLQYADPGKDKLIRDTKREYYICKHIAAVFRVLQTAFTLPQSWLRAGEAGTEVEVA